MHALSEYEGKEVPPEVTVLQLAVSLSEKRAVDAEIEEFLRYLWRDGFLQIVSNQNVAAIVAENDGVAGLTEQYLCDFLDDIGFSRCTICAGDQGCDC